jgi:S-formylglutathione hydrolase FrmB
VRAWVAFSLVALVGCSEFVRAASYDRRASPAMRGTWMEYAVLVPADYADDESLPLVLFLHGGGDGPDCLDRSGLGPELAAAMANGEIPRAVIVVPQGDLGFWANWYDGSRAYEDWVLDDLRPYVERRWNTQPCPTGCHVMGVSMGAEGAVRFAIHRPWLFRSVTSISGPALDTERRIAFVEDRLWQSIIPTYHVFGPSEPRSRIEADDPYLVWSTPESLGDTSLFVAWGSADRGEVREGAMHFEEHLTTHGIPHVSREFEGTHSWTSWGPVIREALVTQLGLAE